MDLQGGRARKLSPAAGMEALVTLAGKKSRYLYGEEQQFSDGPQRQKFQGDYFTFLKLVLLPPPPPEC